MKKILIVDDSSFMRTVLKNMLSDASQDINLTESVEIYEADGKINATIQAKKIKPDLILLDIVMKESETEGLEFINEIKDTFDVDKIIIVSSIGQTAVMEECRRLGVTKYLHKPFEKGQIIEVINRMRS